MIYIFGDDHGVMISEDAEYPYVMIVPGPFTKEMLDEVKALSC